MLINKDKMLRAFDTEQASGFVEEIIDACNDALLDAGYGNLDPLSPYNNDALSDAGDIISGIIDRYEDSAYDFVFNLVLAEMASSYYASSSVDSVLRSYGNRLSSSSLPQAAREALAIWLIDSIEE